MSRGVWVLGALLFVSLGAQAQTEPEEVDAATGRKIKYEQRQEIDFTDLLRLDGELVGPDGEMVQERKPPKFNPLIRLRNDWNPEMKASIDEIK